MGLCRSISLLLLAIPLLIGRASAKSASISLAAKWQATPFLLEAAEFLVSSPPYSQDAMLG